MGTKLRECRSCTAQWTAISVAIADFTFTELQDLSTGQRCQYIDGDVMVTAPDIITLGSVARWPAHSGDYWDVSWPPLGRPAFQKQSEREKKGDCFKEPDFEACLQTNQWRNGKSPWRPFRLSVLDPIRFLSHNLAVPRPQDCVFNP